MVQLANNKQIINAQVTRLDQTKIYTKLQHANQWGPMALYGQKQLKSAKCTFRIRQSHTGLE